jgi:hypothetical protein
MVFSWGCFVVSVRAEPDLLSARAVPAFFHLAPQHVRMVFNSSNCSIFFAEQHEPPSGLALRPDR